MVSHHGKYTRIERNNPLAVGRCDYSGFLCRRADLIQQMEYRGENLVPTGFLVHPRFADKPNPQMKPWVALGDPYPVYQPRPDDTTD